MEQGEEWGVGAWEGSVTYGHMTASVEWKLCGVYDLQTWVTCFWAFYVFWAGGGEGAVGVCVCVWKRW